MRAIWTGALSFGLVNIPVRLYSATAEGGLKFHYLHKDDKAPIRYARVCRSDGREIPYEEIVKGYEYQKGDFVILTEEDFKRAGAQKTKTIDIIEFTDLDQIEAEYYAKPYYLEPAKGAERPYALLREALKKSGKVGIAKFVLRNREHLAVVKPSGDALVLEQLRYKQEVREPELKLPGAAELPGREVEMAIQLIDQLSGPFRPEEHHDNYTEELERVIAAKVAGETPSAVPGEEPTPTRVPDLMATLRASLERERERTKVGTKGGE